MYEPVQKCNNCGAGLTLDDLRLPNCKYCQTVFPHRAQAEQHQQMIGNVMNQMMAQQAQIQNQWRAGFGVGPIPGQMPMGMPGGAPPTGAAPPLPPGAPPLGAPCYPYADPMNIAAAHAARSAAIGGGIMVMTIVIVIVVLMIVGGVVGFVVLR